MTTELTTIEQDPPRNEHAVATIPDQQAGTFALAAMTDQEFETRLAALKKGRDRIAKIQRELMTPDVDYGTIPGTPKPTLLKPGAEKLCDWYGFRADFLPQRLTGDGLTTPALAYQTRCELHLGSLDGPVVAVGYGSANSWERKHRYRTGERACPACGTIGTLLRSKKGRAEWFCWAKKGGCGQTFAIDDPAVTEQRVGDIENPDPYDLDTTLLKMAEKRAHVDATLRATAASGLFTQDVEDLPHVEAAANVTTAVQPLEDRIAARKAEVTGACSVASPRGDACQQPAGHEGGHRAGVKRWGNGPAPEPAETAVAAMRYVDAEPPIIAEAERMGEQPTETQPTREDEPEEADGAELRGPRQAEAGEELSTSPASPLDQAVADMPEKPKAPQRPAMVQCESISPYGDGEQCRNAEGHDGRHRTSKASWE